MSQLNDQTEQQLYNGMTASSPATLTSQLERQMYNAYQAAGGGGGGGGGGATPELTEERVVGKLNGKPVYEITLTGTISGGASAWRNVVATPSNIDVLMSIFAKMDNADGSQTALPYAASSSSMVSLRYLNGKIQVYYTNSQYTGFPFMATIRYTKTTD